MFFYHRGGLEGSAPSMGRAMTSEMLANQTFTKGPSFVSTSSMNFNKLMPGVVNQSSGQAISGEKSHYLPAHAHGGSPRALGVAGDVATSHASSAAPVPSSLQSGTMVRGFVKSTSSLSSVSGRYIPSSNDINQPPLEASASMPRKKSRWDN